MSKEKLEARLQDIEKSMQQLISNLNMLEGGKQECLYWLKSLEEKPSCE